MRKKALSLENLVRLSNEQPPGICAWAVVATLQMPCIYEEFVCYMPMMLLIEGNPILGYRMLSKYKLYIQQLWVLSTIIESVDFMHPSMTYPTPPHAGNTRVLGGVLPEIIAQTKGYLSFANGKSLRMHSRPFVQSHHE